MSDLHPLLSCPVGFFASFHNDFAKGSEVLVWRTLYKGQFIKGQFIWHVIFMWTKFLIIPYEKRRAEFWSKNLNGCFFLGPWLPEGHWAAGACPKEGNETGEGSGKHVLWGEAETTGVVSSGEEDIQGDLNGFYYYMSGGFSEVVVSSVMSQVKRLK